MQAPPSHLYYVHWIHRSWSYSETSPIGLQYYHGLGSVDIISCYLTVLWPRPSHRSRDSQQRWHDVMVWLSCHLTWSHRGSWTPQIYLITAISIVSDDSSVSVLFDHLLAPAIALSSVQSTLVSGLDPLLPPTLLLLATPSQLIASPVSQWTTPLSAQRLQFLILKNRCCFPRRPSQISNLESGPLSVV